MKSIHCASCPFYRINPETELMECGHKNLEGKNRNIITGKHMKDNYLPLECPINK